MDGLKESCKNRLKHLTIKATEILKNCFRKYLFQFPTEVLTTLNQNTAKTQIWHYSLPTGWSDSTSHRTKLSEKNRTLITQVFEVGDVHQSVESASDNEENLRSTLLDLRMTSSGIGRRINTIVARPSTQLETLIQSVRELNEGNSTRSTKGSIVFERSRSSDQRSHITTGAASNPIDEWQTQHRYIAKSSAGNTPYSGKNHMAAEDESGGECDDQIDQFMAPTTNLPRRLHTTQAKTKPIKRK